MGFELKSGSTVWSPAVAPSLRSPGQKYDSGIFAESVEDPNIQWANRVHGGARSYAYIFTGLTQTEINDLESFFATAGGLTFQMREGTSGDPCAEFTSYRNVTFADDGYVLERSRVNGKPPKYAATILLQSAA